jgi:hypothetical protein
VQITAFKQTEFSMLAKFMKNAFIATLFCSNAMLLADDPIYSLVHTTPYTSYYFQDSWILSDLVINNSAAVVIDVESRDGSVARYLAEQNIPTVATIYSISLWQSSDPTIKHQYQSFLSNVKQENTTNIIVPIRMGSQEAALALNIGADFIYLASNNTFTLANDIVSWSSHLNTKGILCGSNWLDTGVQAAVTSAAAKLGLLLSINDDIWYLQQN